MSNLAYRPDIDGLRAVAVVAVLIFHLDNRWLPGGFLGVDVFFVISGFLITSIIYPQTSRNEFSITQFFRRRIKRLYPALLVVVAVTLVAGHFLVTPPERSKLPIQALAAILSFENILLWKTTGGYWSLAAENIPFLHAWSLSLEEQFYICFPVLLLAIHRLKPGAELSILSLGFILSLALCVYVTPIDRNAAFYMLPTRMWELLSGAILAIWQIERPRQVSKRVGMISHIIAFVLLGMSMVWIGNSVKFPGYLPLLPCLGTLLILGTGSSSAPNRILAYAPVVYVGRLSYSLYLWHWPVILYLKVFPNYSPMAAVGLSGILSCFSYHLVEHRFRYNPVRRRTIALACVLMALCFLPVLRYSSPPLLNQNLKNVFSQASLTRGFPYEAIPALREGKGGLRVVGGEEPGICVIGDSHARMLCAPIENYARVHELSFDSMACSSMSISRDKFFMTIPNADDLNRHRLNRIEELQPKITIIAGRWEDDLAHGGDQDSLREAIQFISANSDHVIVLGQVPLVEIPEKFHGSFRKYIFSESLLGGYPDLQLNRDVSVANKVLEDLIAELDLENVEYASLYDLFVREDGRFILQDQSRFLYSDFQHVNDMGAEWIFQKILQEKMESAL